MYSSTTEIDTAQSTVIVPYAKNKDQPDTFSLLIFTKTEGEISIKQLKDWQHSQVVKGQWKGKMAGGAQSEDNRKTWHKNPFFSLHIPEKKDVEVAIVLAQKKNAMEEIIPYQILPYDFFIGFYLYDAEVEQLIGQTTKWKNAMEGIWLLLNPPLASPPPLSPLYNVIQHVAHCTISHTTSHHTTHPQHAHSIITTHTYTCTM